MFTLHTRLRVFTTRRFLLRVMYLALFVALLGWGTQRILQVVGAHGNFLSAVWSGQPNPGSREPQQDAAPGLAGKGKLSQQVNDQIQAILEEKLSLTPAQRKLDSQLFQAIKMHQGRPVARGLMKTEIRFAPDQKGQVIVDIRANLGGSLIEDIEAAGGKVISALPQYRSVVARVSLNQVETLAARSDVLFIQPQQEYMTQQAEGANAFTTGVVPAAGLSPGFMQRAQRLRSYLGGVLPAKNAGAINPFNPFVSPLAAFGGSQTSEGDKAHRADAGRVAFGVSGAGVKIGVLSNGVASLATSQAAGDLGTVTVLPGQAGTGDEGTAMLEIVHDLAPNAQLYFATANGGTAIFAQNIRDLRTAGCDIIVDDVFYFVESPFQDGQAPGVVSPNNAGVITQAVNDVTAAGAMYFSSAGNSGNKNDGTSGTWEGDFADGGNVTGPIATAGETGRVHSFGGQLYNVLTMAGRVNMYWSDPLGGSTNDYDVFALNSTGTTLTAFSAAVQNGTQDPYEDMGNRNLNERIVIVKFSGSDRFLHLSTNRGRLSISTEGQTHGHATAANAFCVAATPAVGPFPNPFSASNVVENFSSDGPRRLFFNANGSAITPGNVSATGGLLRQKPDITAADGVSVTGVGGFGSPFFGTSAAAPHAAAIAGLIKSGTPSFTNAQIRAALLSSAIDIEGAGVDRDSGAGIIMAYETMQALGMTANANLAVGTVTATESPLVDGNINAGDAATLSIQLLNIGATQASNIVATLTTSTPGVTILSPNTRSYPDIPAGGSAISSVPFVFTLDSSVPCPTTINFTLTVNFGGGISPRSFDIPVLTGQPPFSISTTLDTTAPTSSPGVTTATNTQLGRLSRSGLPVQCGSTKTFPGVLNASTSYRYDSYTFATCGTGTRCVTVQMTGGANLTNLFVAAYSGTYNPASPSTGYLADAGSSSDPQSFSFNITAGSTFTVIVEDTLAGGGGVGTNYSLNVSGMCTACSTAITPPNANLAISKTDSPDPVPAGANITYTINLNNGGPGAANNVAVTDAIPANTTFVSAAVTTGTGWSVSTPPVGGTGNVIFGKGIVANGESAVFSVVVQTSPSANATTISNTAAVTTTSNNTGASSATTTTFVGCPPLVFSPTTLPHGIHAVPYSQSLTVTTGVQPYTFSLMSGSLPPGITLNPNGLLSGTPTAVGTFNFTVKAQNGVGCMGTQDYVLVIDCQTVTLSPASLADGDVGTAYSQTVTASPAGGNYVYSITNGFLPPGLSLNPTMGAITGVPSQTGLYNFRISADGFGTCHG